MGPLRLPGPLALACAALLAAGCGYERTKPPDVTRPDAPTTFQALEFPEHGVAFSSPANWPVTRGPAPLVASITSGRAALAVWRYPRTEPVPRTPAEVREVVPELVAEARKREPGVKLGRPEVRRFAGKPGVMLVGEQRIAGQRRRLRSVHVFDRGAEVVLDGLAPPRDFERVDREVFMPVLRSLRLSRAEPPQ